MSNLECTLPIKGFFETALPTRKTQQNPEAWLNLAKYMKAGIDLQFIDYDSPAYSQRQKPFEPVLSVLSVLMSNTPGQVRAILDDVTFGQ